MTDRLSGVIVTFIKDIRVDDAKHTIAALKQIKGVLSVKPLVDGQDVEVSMATERVRADLSEKLIKVLHPDWPERTK